MICAGAQYSGSFHGCTFLSSALYAVHGAAVTLRRCRILDCQPGITVSGDAAVAAATQCTFRGCATSIVADGGGTVSVDSCRIERTFAAVVSNGPGSHVTLRRCTARNTLDAPFSGTGVGVRGGAVLLDSCSLAGFTTAVCGVWQSACIEAQRVWLTDSPQGVTMSAHSRAVLRACNILCDGTGPNVPIPVAVFLGMMEGHAGGAHVQLERCNVHPGTVRGIGIQDRSAVAARLCDFSCTKGVLVSGLHGGRATLAHCTGASPEPCLRMESEAGVLRVEGGQYEGGTTACFVLKGGRLSAADCELRSRGVPQMSGVVKVRSRACARLSRCRIHHGVTGIDAEDCTLYASDVAVSDMLVRVPVMVDQYRPGQDNMTGGIGIQCMGVRAEVRRCALERCAVGIGAEQGTGRGRDVLVEGVRLTHCARGMQVLTGAQVEVVNCAFRGLEWSPPRGARADMRQAGVSAAQPSGAVFVGSGRGSVVGCSFEGHLVDVSAGSRDGITVRECEFTGGQVRGACVVAAGVVAVEDCRMVGVSGVQAQAGAVCTVRRCRITCARPAFGAVVAEEGSCVKLLDDTVIDGTGNGVVAEGRAEVALQDCRISVRGEDACGVLGYKGGGCVVTAKRVTIAAQYLAVSATCIGGRPVTVKLEDCVVSKSGGGVFVAGTGGTAAVVRSEVSDCDVGVCLAGKVKARLRDSTVARCARGVMVGDTPEDVKDACGECGCEGRAGLVRAYEALLASGGDPARGGRCSHAATVTCAKLKGVEVAACSDVGLLVWQHGHVEAEGVTARECGTGFRVTSIGRRNVFADCRAVRCAVPVLGWRQVTATGDNTLVPEAVQGVSGGV